MTSEIRQLVLRDLRDMEVELTMAMASLPAPEDMRRILHIWLMRIGDVKQAVVSEVK